MSCGFVDIATAAREAGLSTIADVSSAAACVGLTRLAAVASIFDGRGIGRASEQAFIVGIARSKNRKSDQRKETSRH